PARCATSGARWPATTWARFASARRPSPPCARTRATSSGGADVAAVVRPATAYDDVIVTGMPSRELGNRPDWQRKDPQVARYNASYTGTLFHLSNKRVRGLMGPLGSGKSTACSNEIMARAVRQPI